MKIVVLDGYTENPGDLSWEALASLGDLTVYDRTPRQEQEEIIRRMKGAEIVITNKTPITRQIIDACSNLRYIGLLSTGYNIVDYQYAGEKGIPVTNIPAYGTEAVAQFTIALLLEICHHIGLHSQAVHEGKWENCPDFCFWESPLIELQGKVLGIVGFGRIGRSVARIGEALGMNVLAYSPHRKPEEERETCRYASLDQIFQEADVISLHCPLFPENERMINRETLSRMKDGVILLNTSRGQLIDEQALAEGLNSGKVYAAGLDVLAEEPPKGDNPLLKAKNCIITPHIAWASRAARERLMNIAVSNLKAFLTGQPENVVN